MFNRVYILMTGFASAVAALIFFSVDGKYLFITDTYSIHLNVSFLTIIFFVLTLGCVGLLLVSVIPLVGGISGSEESEEPIGPFTYDDLVQMDIEDEQHWNRTQRSTALSTMDPNATYEDYRGYLREAQSNIIIYNNHTDRRRVRGGFVSKKFSRNEEGEYVLND